MSYIRKKLALAVSAIMAVSVFSSCGGNNSDTETGETSFTTSLQLETEEKISEDLDFFSEDYDPFSDNYDPYGGNKAIAAEHDLQTDDPDKTNENSDEDSASEQDDPDPNADITADSDTEKNSGNDSPDKAPSKNDNNGVELTINSANGWNDGTNDFIQLDGTVKNGSDKVLNGWTVTIPASKNVRVDQSWNCNIDVKGETITVTPVDYNTNIDPNSEGTFGMILCNSGKIDSSKATVKTGSMTVSGSGNGSGNSGGGQSGQTGSVGNNNPKIVQAKNVPEPTTDDWLHTDGSKIYDKDGREVWLTGINWFGYNTGTNTFDGLWTCDLNTSLSNIADRGFNLMRIPMSAELIKEWSNGNYPNANFNQATNSYLVGMNSLEIFDYVIGQCRANGIKIMIDIHSAKTDSMGHMKNLWTDGNISEKDFLDSLAWMANRYKNDDTIIAYDLKNEPHGKANESPRAKWDGSKDSDNWKYIAEKAAKAVLDKNPNVLIMVEGIEIYPIDIKKNGDFSSTNMGDYYCTWWGGNLRGVKNDPVDLGKYQNKLVYSPHDYGPTVYQQPWFQGNYDFNSLYKDCWHDNWFYIQEENIAPLLIGEWGGFMRDPNLKWMTYLRQLIKENRINHTFWCFNSNSGDTGGLVLDDFTTWDEDKYAFVKEVLWQQNGKFVGLDHEIPLGSNGITLSQAK